MYKKQINKCLSFEKKKMLTLPTKFQRFDCNCDSLLEGKVPANISWDIFCWWLSTILFFFFFSLSKRWHLSICLLNCKKFCSLRKENSTKARKIVDQVTVVKVNVFLFFFLSQ